MNQPRAFVSCARLRVQGVHFAVRFEPGSASDNVCAPLMPLFRINNLAKKSRQNIERVRLIRKILSRHTYAMLFGKRNEHLALKPRHLQRQSTADPESAQVTKVWFWNRPNMLGSTRRRFRFLVAKRGESRKKVCHSNRVVRFAALRHLSVIASLRTVSLSIKSLRSSYPRPGWLLTTMVPVGETVTSGSMMSSFQ